MAAAARRRKMIGHRRRVEDEGEDEGGPDALDHDDDSLTDASSGTDDDDAAADSDTSNIEDTIPKLSGHRKHTNGIPHKSQPRANKASAQNPNASPAAAATTALPSKPSADTDAMLNGLSLADKPAPVEEIDFSEIKPSPARSPTAPMVVSSASALRQPPADRRRQEHEDYKKKRDEDPAFVPNRGSFFMHDHRHAGPAANGFRPFGRGRGRGGRGGMGGLYNPMSHMNQVADPVATSQWTHDMHEAVAQPAPRRPRHAPEPEGPVNGNGYIPTREPNASPINRTLSHEKHIGNVQVRVLLPTMAAPILFSGVRIKQYTKLPDHRPPLRRDKPVRISLPDHPPRYIYPAVDRSFIFIPRAMRPNQQRGTRGKPRSGLGSVGGYSRRTSVFGGSYYGSMYSPSNAMSRRSSFGQDRDFMFSPTGSVVSRPPLPVDNNRPVVRLPPAPRQDSANAGQGDPAVVNYQTEQAAAALEPSINNLPSPQTHPLPQKPLAQEDQSHALPMHQPRPQKNISVADIDSSTLAQGPSQAFQQAFHQQVPPHVANGFNPDGHSRHPSYPTQHSTGTPLSQIPERAIHAAPFQPNTYGQQSFYNQQPYQPQPQPGYFYGPGYTAPNMGAPTAAPPFIPSGQPGMAGSYPPQNTEVPPSGNSLVAQEVNGMVYYYDASQMPPVNNYQQFPANQGYQQGVMGMNGMVPPSPDGFFYNQSAPGMVYYR